MTLTFQMYISLLKKCGSSSTTSISLSGGGAFDGWPTLRISHDEIEKYSSGPPKNIGILLGDASGGLVDVDIDRPNALKFASRFLATASIRFRTSSLVHPTRASVAAAANANS